MTRKAENTASVEHRHGVIKCLFYISACLLFFFLKKKKKKKKNERIKQNIKQGGDVPYKMGGLHTLSASASV